MSNKIAAPKEGEANKEFILVPPGTHIARCIRIIDLGHQSVPVYEKRDQFEWKEQIMLTFELPYEVIADKDGVEMPMLISKIYTKSLHENATLRKHLEAWRGIKYTPEQLDDFDANKLADQSCQIVVKHSTYTDKSGKERTSANVDSIVGMTKGSVCPPAKHSVFCYEIEEGDGIHYQELPKWIQEKIAKSQEWKGAPEDKAFEGISPEERKRMDALANPPEQAPGEENWDDVINSDPPF